MTPHLVPTPDEAAELLRSHEGITVEGECWLWDQTPDGYGPVLAFYEAARGPLDPGMTLYHRCANGTRGCVRPSHVVPIEVGVEPPPPPLQVDEARGFARHIADERAARKYTKARMARYLGISVDTLIGWESGIRVPSPDVVRELTQRMGWDRKPRKWVVTVVHQRVIVERSAGAAVRKMWDELTIEGERLKSEVVEVRQVK